MYQRSELDWLIYNDPLSYAELILNGDPELYLKAVTKENSVRLMAKKIRQKQHSKGCASDRFFTSYQSKANTTACCSSLNLDQRSRSFFLCLGQGNRCIFFGKQLRQRNAKKLCRFSPGMGWSEPCSYDTMRRSWIVVNRSVLQADTLSSPVPPDTRL